MKEAQNRQTYMQLCKTLYWREDIFLHSILLVIWRREQNRQIDMQLCKTYIGGKIFVYIPFYCLSEEESKVHSRTFIRIKTW
jgi:hypothetical protein